VPGQFHSPHGFNYMINDNPSINPLGRTDAQTHKIYMNESKENYQRFKPYFYMDQVEKDSQYDMTTEHLWLGRIPMFFISCFIFYYLISNYDQKRKFREMEKNLKSLEPYEYEFKGIFLCKAENTKFPNKFQTREEYHKFIDNDLRVFSKQQ
jgi:hypothetical protein